MTRALTHLSELAAARLLAVAHAVTDPSTGCVDRRMRRGELGQSTVEYALILLGAAAIALMVVAWVTRSDAIGQLFDTVLGRVLQQAG